ncbi:helix-turn-helix domain-containing protein [Parablautia muri]|uniref:AraC family transcriptional regulator n=1 Tax=Parablautia muri TaxID=2320879 RepID=A0A9X5BFI8_9FIRM|nr:AraC family transcriptional regulator [Parablautia muri]NBJ92698.1 AraC family transcriptional regulator [Parablautia muri]
MYSNTGYLYDEDIETEDLTHPLTVLSCGIYRLSHQPVMPTLRPKGRKDYQLLYIFSGKAFFSFHDSRNKEVEIPAGHMVLYRPGESQEYHYYAKDNPEVCWIHFSGCQADEFLDKIGFSKSHTLFCGTSFHYPELFRRIILELQLKRPCFEELLRFYLGQLFTEIHRSQLEFSAEKYRNQKEMEATVHYFNEFFTQAISIEEYAAGHHMSISWFIRSFKRYMGMTPMQYITSIRINKAKELLKNTNCSIQEISGLVGYENPLYFSRIFRKQTGLSPSQYRKEGVPKE